MVEAEARAPKYGAIGGQLPDVSGGALRNLQVTRPPGPAMVRTQPLTLSNDSRGKGRAPKP